MSRPPKLEAPWLASEHCQLAAKALGAEHMRFVGGAVRNSLLGKAVADIDVATTHTPDKATILLESKGFKVIPTGIDHGTITAVLDGEVLEITTLRYDVETDGRRAKVAFTNEWGADAARRDFTMNAIYASCDGTLFDPFGGLDDIKAGRVRFIGDAEDRIKEDALRILRLFRFQALYGRQELDRDTLNVVERLKGLVGILSIERIASELLKILIAPEPERQLRMMQKLGIMNVIFPNMSPDFESLASIAKRGEQKNQALRNFLALYRDVSADLGKKLRLSNKQCDYLAAASALVKHAYPLEDAIWKECIYYNTRAVALDALLLTHSDVEQSFYEVLKDWTVPAFPLSGGDILALGVKSGPDVGKTLKEKETLWIESDYQMTKEELLKAIP